MQNALFRRTRYLYVLESRKCSKRNKKMFKKCFYCLYFSTETTILGFLCSPKKRGRVNGSGLKLLVLQTQSDAQQRRHFDSRFRPVRWTLGKVSPSAHKIFYCINNKNETKKRKRAHKLSFFTRGILSDRCCCLDLHGEGSHFGSSISHASSSIVLIIERFGTHHVGCRFVFGQRREQRTHPGCVLLQPEQIPYQASSSEERRRRRTWTTSTSSPRPKQNHLQPEAGFGSQEQHDTFNRHQQQQPPPPFHQHHHQRPEKHLPQQEHRAPDQHTIQGGAEIQSREDRKSVGQTQDARPQRQHALEPTRQIRMQGQEEVSELGGNAEEHTERRGDPQRRGEDLRGSQVQRATFAERVAQAPESLGGRERTSAFRQQSRADVGASEDHPESTVQTVKRLENTVLAKEHHEFGSRRTTTKTRFEAR